MVALVARRKGLDRWIFTYIRERSKYHAPRAGEPVHLLLCIADHFEPGNGGVTPDVARQRLQRWVEDYPRLCQRFRDSDGGRPGTRSSTPSKCMTEAELDALAGLCRLGLGEVEIHLHHDGDTSSNLRTDAADLRGYPGPAAWIAARHRETGALAYGFVHGNWALDNSQSRRTMVRREQRDRNPAARPAATPTSRCRRPPARRRRARSIASITPSTIPVDPSRTTGELTSGKRQPRATA